MEKDEDEMGHDKEEIGLEENVKEEDFVDRNYEVCDKKTLIKILMKKDELISQNTETVNRLQGDIGKYKEDNEHLRAELVKLNTELQHYKENSSEKKLIINQTLSISTPPQERAENENGTDYDEQKPMPDWSGTTNNDSAMSISDLVRATAEAELETLGSKDNSMSNVNASTCNSTANSDYVYDASSGYYYHPPTGYYWDPNSELFYDYTSGSYFRYNETNGEYEVHSQVVSNVSSEKTEKDHNLPSTIDNPSSSLKRKESSKKRKKRKHKSSRKSKFKSSKIISKEKNSTRGDNKKKRSVNVKAGKKSKATSDRHYSDSDNGSSGSLATDESEIVSDPESGEIVSSSSSCSSDVEIVEEEMLYEQSTECAAVDVCFMEMEQQYPEAMAENYPPCIRAIVQESEKLCLGTLFIITCAGGTIGRDATAKHIIEIPDIGVSKNHASIDYDYELSCYKVTDLGSQNGTRVNGGKLCQSKFDSGSCALNHGDVLQVGNGVSLLLHIHQGYETCEDCEPGQIQAKLKARSIVKNTHVVLTKGERRQQQRKELKNIKKKYGLQNSYFENEGAIPKDPDYTDKAHLRRKFIGSENEITKTESPASVHSPIAPSNKGHRLLAKMGWKEGQGLGKANAGIAEPINVELRVNQNAGLGSRQGHSLSLDRVQDSNKAKRWSQAQHRFNRLKPTHDAFSENDSTDCSANLENVSTDFSRDTQTQIPSTKPKPSQNTKVSKPQTTWHKGGTETLSNNPSDIKDS